MEAEVRISERIMCKRSACWDQGEPPRRVRLHPNDVLGLRMELRAHAHYTERTLPATNVPERLVFKFGGMAVVEDETVPEGTVQVDSWTCTIHGRGVPAVAMAREADAPRGYIDVCADCVARIRSLVREEIMDETKPPITELFTAAPGHHSVKTFPAVNPPEQDQRAQATEQQQKDAYEVTLVHYALRIEPPELQAAVLGCAHETLRARAGGGVECPDCRVVVSDQALKRVGTPPYDQERMRLADEWGRQNTALYNEVQTLSREHAELLRENATLRRRLEALERKKR